MQHRYRMREISRTYANVWTAVRLRGVAKINLLRPALGSHLRAVAKVIRAGRRMHIVNTRVLAEQNGRTRLVSFLTATIAVVDRQTPSAKI